MTAVPSRHIVGRTDAELARAAAGGDRGAFADIYDRYADRLHDFCIGILRDRDSAADCVQDTFCIAATRLTQLQQPDSLRPWLYSIARNDALGRLRERRRETPTDELPDAMSYEPGPETLAARTELADLIAEAAGGLSDRDRSVLELAYRHGLDGPELAEALQVSRTNANTLVHRLRETIERSLGALLVSRQARKTPDGCPELTTLLDGWDGQFSVLMRKRIARHIECCSICEESRRRLVSPAALLGATPVFIPAPAWLRERTLSDIRLVCLDTPMSENTGAESVAFSQDPPMPDGLVDDIDGRRTRNVMLLVILFAATLLIALGMTIAWVHQRETAVTPVDVTETSPEISDPLIVEPTLSNPPPALPTVVDTVPVIEPPDQLTPPVITPVAPTPPPDSGPPQDSGPPPDSGAPTESMPTPEVVPTQSGAPRLSVTPQVPPQRSPSSTPTVSVTPRTASSNTPTNTAVITPRTVAPIRPSTGSDRGTAR